MTHNSQKDSYENSLGLQRLQPGFILFNLIKATADSAADRHVDKPTA